MAELILDRPRITPFLWFESAAADAARFYTSIFANSWIERAADEDVPIDALPDDDVMSVSFWLDGQRLIAFNGGPHHAFTPAISLFVRCETQAEVDYFWDALVAGGEPSRCGWLTDKYGVSWQIVPDVLADLLGSDDREAAGRAMHAMLGMQKLDIPALAAAARGEATSLR